MMQGGEAAGAAEGASSAISGEVFQGTTAAETAEGMSSMTESVPNSSYDLGGQGSFVGKNGTAAGMVQKAIAQPAPTNFEKAFSWLDKKVDTASKFGLKPGDRDATMPEAQVPGGFHPYQDNRPMMFLNQPQSQPYVPIQPRVRQNNMDWLAFLNPR